MLALHPISSLLGKYERLGLEAVVDDKEHVEQIARRHDEAVAYQEVLQQLQVCRRAHRKR